MQGGKNRINGISTQELHSRLIAGLDLSKIGSMTDDEIRSEIRQSAGELCNQSSSLLTTTDRERLVNEVMDEAFGLGPLETLLRDTTISDILVNGPYTVYVERRGRLELTDVKFADEPHLLQIIQRIVGRVGRRIDETSPIADARLADGSRVNAIIPPLALDGSLLCIRRFSAKPLKAEDLIARGVRRGTP
jgi:pilus assembly protein CpaF